ncbi:uncharacterized protein LOC135955673 [Calliphora vicina]|uniref:uncharacterized protein LOC135955673 n=1 Tax=Calliphora vicina TaxID=7373 RepID=UPI00325B3620
MSPSYVIKPKNDRVGELLRDCLPSSNVSWEETCNLLRNLAKDEIGYKCKENRKIWISDITWNFIQERSRLKQQKLEDPNLKPRYNTVAKAVKTSARRDKRKYIENIAIEAEAAAGANNMKELHQLIGRLSNQNMSRNHAVKDTNGQLLTNLEDQTRRWKQHFEGISNIAEDISVENPSSSFVATTIANHIISDDDPSFDEITCAILKLKRNKAPGEDGISPEFLQANPAISADILQPYIRDAWANEQFPNTWTKGVIIKLPKKNDLTNCDNWRGITLLNTIYKIIAVINNRLQCVEQTLRDEQAGFRSHRNCLDQTNTLRVIIE